MKNQLLIFVLFVLLLNTAYAQNEVYVKSNQAIQGYDPVAYFKEDKPVKGKKEFSFQWKEASWFFANQENLNDFRSNPEKYAPQFGGYCAYGIYDGHKAPTDPEAWTIVDHKLYLNYNKEVRALWKKDQAACIKKANENWPQIKQGKD